ncbi:hypothetical protein NKH18_02870 [Streptomyces sp. M10(2022)]
MVTVGDLPRREAEGRDDRLERAFHHLFAGGRKSRVHRAKDPAEAATIVAAAGGAAATLSPATPMCGYCDWNGPAGRRSSCTTSGQRRCSLLRRSRPWAYRRSGIRTPERSRRPTSGIRRPSRRGRGRDEAGTAVSLTLEAKATLAVVFRPPSHSTPAHAVQSNVPVEDLTVEGRTGTATVRVSSAMTVRIAAVHGKHRYEGSLAATDPLASVPLDGDWSFRFDRDGARDTSRALGTWTDLEPSYSGSAVYERRVTLDAGTLSGRVWLLDLGRCATSPRSPSTMCACPRGYGRPTASMPLTPCVPGPMWCASGSPTREPTPGRDSRLGPARAGRPAARTTRAGLAVAYLRLRQPGRVAMSCTGSFIPRESQTSAGSSVTWGQIAWFAATGSARTECLSWPTAACTGSRRRTRGIARRPRAVGCLALPNAHVAPGVTTGTPNLTRRDRIAPYPP